MSNALKSIVHRLQNVPQALITGTQHQQKSTLAPGQTVKLLKLYSFAHNVVSCVIVQFQSLQFQK